MEIIVHTTPEVETMSKVICILFPLVVITTSTDDKSSGK